MSRTPEIFTGPITMTPVESSQIAAIGYHPQTLTLAVTFKRGGHYRYAGVRPEHWEAFRSAESFGGHFGQHIRGRFEYVRIEVPAQSVGERAAEHLTRALAAEDLSQARAAIRQAMSELGLTADVEG